MPHTETAASGPVGSPAILAAGAVVRRKGGDVLVVHRPKYDDWSLPKGKQDGGELLPATAVREVREETGVDVRLGRPLATQSYPVDAGTKHVHYWLARDLGAHDVAAYLPNEEIDEVVWLPVDEAHDRLSHDRDRATLAEATDGPGRTRTLAVLRHAQAVPRARWHSDDRFRPLAAEGDRQAARLRPLLAAYDVRRLVSSSSTRCLTTLLPYAEACGRHVEVEDVLSEEDATGAAVGEVLDGLRREKHATVLCTHRPVLPAVFAALGLPDPGLAVGELVVVHHRRGDIVATESYCVS